MVLDEFDKKTKMIIFINLAFGLLAIIFQLFLTFYYIDSLPVLVTFISLISLLAYFLISIYSLTRITKLTLTTQKLESAEEYNKSLSILYDNVKGFKHDFTNIVSAIGGYIQTNDMDGLKQYYLQLEDDLQRVNNISALNPEIINNPGVYNLLSSKYHKADTLNIKINLEFFLDLSTLNMKIYEFTRVLGILLDNAIEAASECDEKIINIKFRNENAKNRQVVIVENTYKDKNVDVEKIFEKGVSGKEKHTGLGLWEIRQILKKNTNLNLYTNKSEEFFTQQLEIYTNKRAIGK
jgi:two-component system sensor histidine kinase AgrC